MVETIQKVILGDGTEISGGAASDGNWMIWIMIDDPEDPYNSIPKLIQALCAKGAADRIESRINGKTQEVFEGYTVIDTVRMNSDGMCSARLRRPDR